MGVPGHGTAHRPAASPPARSAAERTPRGCALPLPFPRLNLPFTRPRNALAGGPARADLQLHAASRSSRLVEKTEAATADVQIYAGLQGQSL